MRRRLSGLVGSVVVGLALTASAASAHDVTGVDAPGHGEGDLHSAMSQLFASGPSNTCPRPTINPVERNRPCTNSDMAFWGNRAYQGHYGGFRVFDVSNPASPQQIVDFPCWGPQNDPVIWGNLLFLTVDVPLTGPECGNFQTQTREDPNGWEGVRIFDVSDPANPRFIKGVYTDCGAHTITLFPKNPAQIMLYVSSYPLLTGPTCGPTAGPRAGNSALHEKISVIRVPVNAPKNAKVVAQPKISYPGDPDNLFDPAEHNLPLGKMTGCHDIAVFVQLRLAAGACAEQAQLWRIRPNGIPDTRKPVWVFDDSTDSDGAGGGDAAVDFWHSATFSYDGKVVNFIDESFGAGCPPITPDFGSATPTPDVDDDADTGRMYFVDRFSGRQLSQYTLPRQGESALDAEGNETAYCSAHLGNTVPARDKNLLVNAWYMGGVNVIDFTDPTNPQEVAFWDAGPSGPTGSDNWSAYWYEGPSLPEPSLTIYGTDGVHNPATGRGFQSFVADVAADEVRLPYLNPQTQERALGVATKPGKGAVHKKQNGRGSGKNHDGRGSGKNHDGRGSGNPGKRSGLRGERRGHLAP